MRAVVVESARARPSVLEVDEPVCPLDGVVVRIMATGMCRSDWHGWAGHDDDVRFPHVPGHELAGEVVEVGAQVARWRAGDRVTVPFVCGCGRCEWCISGNAQVCPDQRQPGFTDWGSFAEYVALHAADANLVAVPDDVDHATAASLGCRFATAYHALVARAGVGDGEWLTVVGAGGVGLSAVMIGRAVGARVIAVDRSPEALALATELGAEHALRSGDGDVPARVTALTAGGSHVSMDAVGSEQTCTDAILSLPPRSTRPDRAAATPRRASPGADGARHRVGARPSRKPRDGGRRLPADDGADRARSPAAPTADRAHDRSRRGG